MPDAERGEGWLTFSAIILVFAGVMRIFDSIWAFRAKGSLEDLPNATLGSSVKAYGVYWLIVGVLLIAAGYGVLKRAQWARWFGIIAAAVSAIVAMSWMPYNGLWAFTYVLISVLVIYGLSAYGGLEIPDLPDIPGTTPPPNQPPSAPPTAPPPA